MREVCHKLGGGGGGQFSSSSRSSSIKEGVENKVQSEINVCGKRSVEQMEDQNRMKRTGRFSGRYAGGGWEDRGIKENTSCDV